MSSLAPNRGILTEEFSLAGFTTLLGRVHQLESRSQEVSSQLVKDELARRTQALLDIPNAEAYVTTMNVILSQLDALESGEQLRCLLMKELRRHSQAVGGGSLRLVANTPDGQSGTWVPSPISLSTLASFTEWDVRRICEALASASPQPILPLPVDELEPFFYVGYWTAEDRPPSESLSWWTQTELFQQTRRAESLRKELLDLGQKSGLLCSELCVLPSYDQVRTGEGQFLRIYVYASESKSPVGAVHSPQFIQESSLDCLGAMLRVLFSSYVSLDSSSAPSSPAASSLSRLH